MPEPDKGFICICFLAVVAHSALIGFGVWVITKTMQHFGVI